MTIQARSLVFARLWWLDKRMPPRVPGTFRFPFGRVRYTDASSLLTMYSEIFVDRVYEAELPDTPNILDCGGNIGLSTIWFKLRYPNAIITVFEADPVTVGVLKENVETLGLGSVDVVAAAVSGTAGPISFIPEGPLTGRIGSDSNLTIESVRLSDRVERPVDLLKLDIEGSEFSVIKDLCASGKMELVRKIVCEIHGSSQLQERIAGVWESLAESGFRSAISELRPWATGPGPADPTPFLSVESAKFILHLHAWRPH